MNSVDPFGLEPCSPGQGGCDLPNGGKMDYDKTTNTYTIVEPGSRAAAGGTERGWSREVDHAIDAAERLATTPHGVGGGYTFTPTEYWKGLVNSSADELQSTGTMLSPQGALITWALSGGREAPRARMSMSGGPNDISKDAARVAVILGSFAVGKGLSSGARAGAFTARNFRTNLARMTGGAPKGAQAHHVFPQKFAGEFAQRGINVHEPRFGAWWEAQAHQRAAAGYNAAWEQFLQNNPSAEQILQFGRDISEQYGLRIFF